MALSKAIISGIAVRDAEKRFTAHKVNRASLIL